jgi:eukaryotic-like serine/threonine-protein kinase
MEYVEGEPIDRYCNRHEPGLRRRLELFLTVCGAVQYAHQNLVVHRDIKPANVLVTGEGIPKLLDFGIARLLEAEPCEHTVDLMAAGSRLLTPDYASPEQVAGEPITTASDVYSLGVVLYELLTGQRPYGPVKDQDTLLRTIAEAEPASPSRALSAAAPVPRGTATETDGLREWPPQKLIPPLRRRLRGDLDTIVLKALRKDPRDRYGSVEQLAEDVRRWLSGRPVLAQPATVRYRLIKFVRRHDAGVVAGAVVVISLAGGLGSTLWQARLAERERARAEAGEARAEGRFHDIHRLAQSFMFEMYDALRDVPGTTAVRAVMVQRALEHLDRLAADAGDDRPIAWDLAEAYQRVGDAQGYPMNPNLGDLTGARASYDKALAIADRLAARESGPDPRRLQARILQRRADLLAWSGEMSAALASSAAGLRAYEETAGESGSWDDELSAAIAIIKYGDVLGSPDLPSAGRPADALARYGRALPALADLHERRPDDSQAQRYLALVHERIGAVLESDGRYQPALYHYQESLARRAGLAERWPDHTDIQRDQAVAHEKIGNILKASGAAREALASYRRSHAVFLQLRAADPANANAARSLSISHEKLGGVWLDLGRGTDALRHFSQSLSIVEDLASRDRTAAQRRRDLARVYRRMGDAHRLLARARGAAADRQAGQWREARAWYTRSLHVREALAEDGAEGAVDRQHLTTLARAIADCDAAVDRLARTGRPSAAGTLP